MLDQVRTIKVYTVRVDPCLSKFWYCSKVGETFPCILIVKETNGKILKPMFAVVEKIGDTYKPPGVVRTIRAEDCTVISECLQLFSNLLEYQKNF